MASLVEPSVSEIEEAAPSTNDAPPKESGSQDVTSNEKTQEEDDDAKSPDTTLETATTDSKESDAKESDTKESDAKESDAKATEATPESKKRNVILGVRFYDTKGFCNRLVGDEGDYTVEARAGTFDGLIEEATKEFTRRTQVKEIKDDEDGHQEAADHKANSPQQSLPTDSFKANGPQQSLATDGFETPLRIETIRVRSPAVLQTLANLNNRSKYDQDELNYHPFLFPRPFTTCYYRQAGVKKKLAELKSRLVQEPDAVFLDPKLKSHIDSNDQAVLSRAVQELQVYTEFIDAYIMPLWKQFDQVTETTPRKISYSDIPMLFRAGELAYMSTPAELRNNQNLGIQNVHRMVRSVRDNCALEGNIMWSIYCLDYRDERYVPLWSQIKFPHFEGLTSIADLPCYPLQFHPDYKAVLGQQIIGGENFRKCIGAGVRDLYYSGWTLVTGMMPPSGDTRTPVESEHIESEVILDAKEALQQLPSALIDNGDGPLPSSFEDVAGEYNLPGLRIWRASGRTEHHTNGERIFLSSDAVHWNVWKEVTDEDKFINANDDIADADFTDANLAILPKRLLGYVLRDRKFAIFHVMGFEMHREDQKTNLDSVQMPLEHKGIIRSAVAAHFEKRKRERSYKAAIHSVDLVRGKGNGLVILLHGPPGVGKTLTAEAVALENNKPLFPITCGDLGFTPERVEQSLKDIFRYAHLWDCILLLDEADVFLTRRNVTDLQRNALVSVFLRVLEYYSGILFLTTNRVGAIDEAFRSRVHISLNYKYLNCDDTLAILDTHLKRLPRQTPSSEASEDAMVVMDQQIKDYIKEGWIAYSKKYHRDRGPWNGRQIRNAVHIATCLAIYENQRNSSSGPVRTPVVLTAEHFRTVAKTTTEFDDYMKRVRRADADTMARMAGERDDFHDEEAYEMSRFEGFSEYDQQQQQQQPAPAFRQGGPQSRRGGRPSQASQRSNRSGGPSHGVAQRFASQRAQDDYSYEQPERRPRDRLQPPSNSFQNKGPRSMMKGSRQPSSRDAMPEMDDYHDEDEDEDGEGNEDWQDDDQGYSTSRLHQAAVAQNQGYAWQNAGRR